MVATSWRESRFVPQATNYDCYPDNINPATGLPYICVGLLQVMEIHVQDWRLLQDPYYNVEVAYSLWLKKGNQPWG